MRRTSNRIPGFTAEASLSARSHSGFHEMRLASAEEHAPALDAPVVPAMRCEFKGDEGWCCTASDYCCVWSGSGGAVCGQTS